MSEGREERLGDELVMVTSDSDRSSPGSDPELEELLREIGMARTQVYVNPDKEIDQYLRGKDGHERAKDRMSSGGETSTSDAHAVPVGRWKLDRRVYVDEPSRSMIEAEIKKLKKNWIIPNSVILRPIEEGESATSPPAGLIAIHETMFKHWFTLLLSGWVYYILSALNFGPGQLTMNAWRQLLGIGVLWFFSAQW